MKRISSRTVKGNVFMRFVLAMWLTFAPAITIGTVGFAVATATSTTAYAAVQGSVQLEQFGDKGVAILAQVVRILQGLAVAVFIGGVILFMRGKGTDMLIYGIVGGALVFGAALAIQALSSTGTMPGSTSTVLGS